MIVVVGVPAWRTEPPGPAGRAAAVALAAAAQGASVELVGRVGEDESGDRLLLGLSRGGVGHAAVLRDPARATPILGGVAGTLVVQSRDADSVPSALADDEPFPPSDVLPEEAPVLEGGDLSLGLRYITDYDVLVLTDGLAADALPVAIEAAAYASAHLVVVVPADVPLPDLIPDEATVLSAPPGDPGGTFAEIVGAYAAALDAGQTPAEAFGTAMGDADWEGARG
jgi:hypothetical protein